PDEARLRSLAGPTVQFRGRVSDDEVTQLMQNCYAFVFPGLEDFGITPVEAMACGKPVLAYGGGGALETVVAGKSGLFFYEATAESLAAAISEFEKQTWIPSEIRQAAEGFSEEIFLEKMVGYIEQEIGLDLSRQRQP
ncbi:MAG: glycosyltransferase, partial [Opitutales bacterium]|nr:glycosyltransferase [Opitutales bacterium]